MGALTQPAERPVISHADPIACAPCDLPRLIPLAALPQDATIMQVLLKMRCLACGGRVIAAALDNGLPGWQGRTYDRTRPEPPIASNQSLLGRRRPHMRFGHRGLGEHRRAEQARCYGAALVSEAMLPQRRQPR